MKSISPLIPLPFLLLLLSITTTPSAATYGPSAIYAFGDSMLDAGNNNQIPTLCRADHEPYGSDFPGKSHTGRFSNGKIPGDFLASAYGLKDLLPAYADHAVDYKDLITGVSFASSCSGYSHLTALPLGVHNLDRQLWHFELVFDKMRKRFGLQKTADIVEKALFLISAGSTDIVNDYYMQPLTRAKYSLPSYIQMLLKNMEHFVKKLRLAGARKIAVIGVPPLGCLPIDAFTNIPPFKNESGDPLRRECRDDHNSDAQQYNTNLATRVKKMAEAMHDLKIVYVDYYTPMMNMINKPYDYGFKTTTTSCCGTGAIEVGPLCNVASLMCHDHSEYVFWDSSNPTEAAYKIVAESFKDVIPAAAAAGRPSAIYAFGDSLLDPGNNNKLPTVCRANHKPYGLDFPGRNPTGRFTNGKLPGDMLVSAFRIKDVLPAYADSTVDVYGLLTGVSFASACSGYHDVTAAEVGVLNLDKQFRNFERAFVKMEERFGLPRATATVGNSLFIISAGSSDMIDNYYLLPTTRAKYSLPAYHDMMLNNLDTLVKVRKLYKAGAKYLAIIGLPPLGCLPMDTTVFSQSSLSPSAASQKNANLTGDLLRRECKAKHNKDATEYNAKLQVRVRRLMVAMPKLKAVYMDIFNPMMEMIDKPNQFGFKSTLEGCCGSGSVELGHFAM
ncbi:hypothetical protein SASPL_156675 [Salvia splendens]|uniref:GDSL esterase/lipase n=1 Tax=Salvia splendens TaxID=180675 RepID=A0A8X8YXL0_SALSN|nr:hypothetical protein SASPL_156675 [Salvia splendens]